VVHTLDCVTGWPLSASAVGEVQSVLSGAFNFKQALVWGWIAHNPVKEATAPATGSAGVSPPDAHRVARLLAVARDEAPELGLCLALAVVLGARRGELCGREWRDVELDHREVCIASGVVRVAGRPLIDEHTKTTPSAEWPSDVLTLISKERIGRFAHDGLAVAPGSSPLGVSDRHAATSVTKPARVEDRFGNEGRVRNDPLWRGGGCCEDGEDAVDLVGGVVEVRRDPDVAAAQCDIDSSLGESAERLGIAAPIRMRHDYYRGTFLFGARADEIDAPGQAFDDAPDEGGIVGCDLVDALLEQVFECCCPGHEVEEVCGSEHVVAAGAKMGARPVLALVVEVESDVVGEREPVALDRLELFENVRADPGEAGCVWPAEPFEAGAGQSRERQRADV
jgi:hypothetical protein